MENITLLSLIAAGINFLGIVYLAFFKSYFSEKGKNLATKQDIGDITKEVETIKNQIIFDTQSRMTINDEKRRSVKRVYVSLWAWINAVYRLRVHFFKDYENERLEDIFIDVDQYEINLHAELAEAELVLDDIDIRSLINITHLALIDYKTKVAKNAIDLVTLCKLHKEELRGIDLESHEYIIQYQRHIKEKEQRFIEFAKERNNAYLPFIPMMHKVRIELLSYLKTLR